MLRFLAESPFKEWDFILKLRDFYLRKFYEHSSGYGQLEQLKTASPKKPTKIKLRIENLALTYRKNWKERWWGLSITFSLSIHCGLRCSGNLLQHVVLKVSGLLHLISLCKQHMQNIPNSNIKAGKSTLSPCNNHSGFLERDWAFLLAR